MPVCVEAQDAKRQCDPPRSKRKYVQPETGHQHADSDQTPRRMAFPVNTEYNEHDPYIAPDGRCLFFTSDRPGGYGSADLYVCFRRADASWSDPVNMGETVNSDYYDYCAMLSPDEKYFFFSSSRSGNGDVYWVDAAILDELKSSFD